MNTQSFIIHQWTNKSSAATDRMKFHLFPLRMFKGNIQTLFNAWIHEGEMRKFKLEVVYA